MSGLFGSILKRATTVSAPRANVASSSAMLNLRSSWGSRTATSPVFGRTLSSFCLGRRGFSSATSGYESQVDTLIQSLRLPIRLFNYNLNTYFIILRFAILKQNFNKWTELIRVFLSDVFFFNLFNVSRSLLFSVANGVMKVKAN